MKNIFKIFTLLLLATGMTVVTSCKKYNKYDNKEVVEDDYTGDIELKGDDDEPSGDFNGNNDSGEFSFAWENKKEVASIEYSASFSSGSVNLIINDAKGNEVFNSTINDNNDSSSGKTSEGKEGKWLVTLIFTDFDGSGSYKIEN
ncbi:MAG: hypothetical protein ACQERC_12235 [Bacteroidota bacterium]